MELVQIQPRSTLGFDENNPREKDLTMARKIFLAIFGAGVVMLFIGVTGPAKT